MNVDADKKKFLCSLKVTCSCADPEILSLDPTVFPMF